jgi:hypothetical protein
MSVLATSSLRTWRVGIQSAQEHTANKKGKTRFIQQTARAAKQAKMTCVHRGLDFHSFPDRKEGQESAIAQARQEDAHLSAKVNDFSSINMDK